MSLCSMARYQLTYAGSDGSVHTLTNHKDFLTLPTFPLLLTFLFFRFFSSSSLLFSGSYERLYTNVDGLADDFAAFWGTLAARFQNATNILAFELLNEPFAGNIYKNPELLFPGHADKARQTKKKKKKKKKKQ